MAPPRFKKGPRISKLRLRMRENKRAREAKKGQKSTNRQVRTDLDRNQTAVDNATNGYSLKENIDVKKNTEKATSLKLPENQGLKLKVAEDVKMQREPTDHSFANKKSIREAIAKSKLTAYKDKESSALENIYPAKTIEGQRNSNIKVLNAWNTFNADPKNNLMFSNEGFSHGGNVFKRDAEGKVTYRALLDKEKGEYGVEKDLKTLGRVGINEMYEQQRKKRASRFTQSIAGKTHAREAGKIYNKETGEMTTPTAAGGNFADYYFSGLNTSKDGGIVYTKGSPLKGQQYKTRSDGKKIIGRN